mmetsp:Transcript_43833/g.129771  ORF Transcript_43833/g.129771 Transcript_43833/m.129771 type:complete len:413 (+) Transcript_43833:451-1689(+)
MLDEGGAADLELREVERGPEGLPRLPALPVHAADEVLHEGVARCDLLESLGIRRLRFQQSAHRADRVVSIVVVVVLLIIALRCRGGRTRHGRVLIRSFLLFLFLDLDGLGQHELQQAALAELPGVPVRRAERARKARQVRLRDVRLDALLQHLHHLRAQSLDRAQVHRHGVGILFVLLGRNQPRKGLQKALVGEDHGDLGHGGGVRPDSLRHPGDQVVEHREHFLLGVRGAAPISQGGQAPAADDGLDESGERLHLAVFVPQPVELVHHFLAAAVLLKLLLVQLRRVAAPPALVLNLGPQILEELPRAPQLPSPLLRVRRALRILLELHALAALLEERVQAEPSERMVRRRNALWRLVQRLVLLQAPPGEGLLRVPPQDVLQQPGLQAVVVQGVRDRRRKQLWPCCLAARAS